MNTENLNCMMTASGMVASRVTEIGDEFIRFITRQQLVINGENDEKYLD